MMDFINNFHFLRPWYLLFLFLPFLLYLKKVNIGHKVSSWEDICDKHLLDFLLVGNKNSKKISFTKFIYLGLISASIAVAGPCWKKIEVPSFTIENPNIFVLSIAQDMLVRDVTPSRLDRAKFLIRDVVDGIKQGQFGLEVYSLEPYIISPITDDKELIKNLLPQINFDIMPDNGDRLDRAIDLAIKKFQDGGYRSGNIILFSADIGQRFDLALEAVEKAKKLNYTVNVIDASLEKNDKLEILAKNGDGIYLMAKNGNIYPLIEKLSKINDEKAKLSQNMRSNFEDFGYYLLVIPLISLLVFFRKGVLGWVFLFISFNANASMWLNDNQEALSFFNEQKYDEALQKFDDPIWKSITLYKLNKNEEALKEIGDTKDEIGLYNKGVILTKLCKYEEAKKVFEEVIKKYPNNEDARYNNRVLEDLFEKAKSDPSLLICDNQKEQNKQNQKQNDNNDNEDEEKKEQNNKNNKNQSQKQNENKNDKNSNDKKNSSSNENEEKSNKEQENKQNDEKDNKQESNENKNSQNEKTDDSNKNDNNKQDNDNNGKSNSSNDKGNDENKEKNKDKHKENNNGNSENAKNDKNDQNNNEGEQLEEQNVEMANAKKTDEDEDFDEEALIMQRKYREIPDDVGGLLREFIKKEYLKDRYNDENN